MFGTDGTNLLLIDPVTGAGTDVGPLSGGSASIYPSLAVDPTTGVMYAGGGAGTPDLYTVNPSSGALTFVGSTGLGLAAIEGLDFRGDGTLYASVSLAGSADGGADHLARIDKATGAATVIGAFGSCTGVTVPSAGGGSCSIEGVDGIAFDAAGKLWGALGAGGVGAQGLYKIDLATGSASLAAGLMDDSRSAPSGGLASLRFSCDGALWGGTANAVGTADDGGKILAADPLTGVFDFAGTASAAGGGSLAGLAFQEPCLQGASVSLPVPFSQQSSLGALHPMEPVTFDTDPLTGGSPFGPGRTVVVGTNLVEDGFPVRVFDFDSINIPQGTRISATGPGPLILTSGGAIVIAGTIDLSGSPGGTNADGGGGGGAGGGTLALFANGSITVGPEGRILLRGGDGGQSLASALGLSGDQNGAGGVPSAGGGGGGGGGGDPVAQKRGGKGGDGAPNVGGGGGGGGGGAYAGPAGPLGANSTAGDPTPAETGGAGACSSEANGGRGGNGGGSEPPKEGDNPGPDGCSQRGTKRMAGAGGCGGMGPGEGGFGGRSGSIFQAGGGGGGGGASGGKKNVGGSGGTGGPGGRAGGGGGGGGGGGDACDKKAAGGSGGGGASGGGGGEPGLGGGPGQGPAGPGQPGPHGGEGKVPPPEPPPRLPFPGDPPPNIHFYPGGAGGGGSAALGSAAGEILIAGILSLSGGENDSTSPGSEGGTGALSVFGRFSSTGTVEALIHQSSGRSQEDWFIAGGGGGGGAAGRGQSIVIPPICRLHRQDPGPPASIEVYTEDNESGLGEIKVLEQTNADVKTPPFEPGTNDPVIVKATKINPDQKSVVRLEVIDVEGNSVTCDPVITLVIRETGKPVTQAFDDIPQAESKVEVFNGSPGLKNLVVTVNGVKHRLDGLKDGEQRTLDVAASMRPGHQNSITLTAYGKPGGSATLIIHD